MSKPLDIAIKNYKKHMEDRDYPACFGSVKDFDMWCLQESFANTKVCRKLVCRDCCSAHQRKMGVEGRCFNREVDLTKIVK